MSKDYKRLGIVEYAKIYMRDNILGEVRTKLWNELLEQFENYIRHKQIEAQVKVLEEVLVKSSGGGNWRRICLQRLDKLRAQPK